MHMLRTRLDERQSRHQPTFGGELSDERLTITKLLHVEFLNTGRLIATTTSGINLWLAGNCTGARNLEAFIPADPFIFPSLIKKILNLGLSCETLQSIQTFYARLDFAKRMLRLNMLNGDIDADQSVAEVEHTASAWRSLCGLNISLIYESQSMILCQAGSAPAFQGDSEVLMMLSAACDGGHPNLVDGSLTVPDWAERRRHSRVHLDSEAALEVDQQVFRVRTSDVSTVGICVEPAPSLSGNKRLAIILEDGRRLAGTVKWIKGTRAGIEFDTELNIDDPLLTLQPKH